MKAKKIIVTLAILFISMLIANTTLAYTISIDDVTANKDEEFTVVLNVDVSTALANGKITYDSSKLEFVGTTQDNMTSSEEEGCVSWIYIDTTLSGVEQFEFTFKVVEDGESEMSFDDLAFVDSEGNEYEIDDISGNTTLKINASTENEIDDNTTSSTNSEENNALKIAIIVAVVIILLLVILVTKKNKKN